MSPESQVSFFKTRLVHLTETAHPGKLGASKQPFNSNNYVHTINLEFSGEVELPVNYVSAPKDILFHHHQPTSFRSCTRDSTAHAQTSCADHACKPTSWQKISNKFLAVFRCPSKISLKIHEENFWIDKHPFSID